MITYRQATIDDAAAIATVEVESKRASIPDICGPMQMDHNWSLERWTTYINRTRSPTHGLDPRIIYLACDGAGVVGYGACHHTTKRGIDAELQSIYVLKDYQRQGIGTALVKLLVRWAQATGRHSLLAGFHGDNPYVAFYQKLGGDLADGPCIWRDLRPLAD